MNVGELHGAVIHGLERPAARIEGYGTGVIESNNKKLFKKVAESELKAIRSARRFDVDDELMLEIINMPACNSGSSNADHVLAGVMAEVRAPFPRTWIEYAQGEDGRLVGCLFEDHGTHFELHFYSEHEEPQHKVRYHIAAIQYHRDKDSFWYGDVIKKGESYPDSLFEVGACCYGIDNHEGMTEQTRAMLHKSNPIGKGIYGFHHDLHDLDLWFGFQVRYVCMLLQVLNYPWVSYEPVMVVTGRKTKTPQIRPHDTYYRAKINLPKEQHVMREIKPNHDPAHSKRLHQVRGHWRVYREPDGSFRKRVWINQHTRGNAKLGVVVKDYQLNYEDSE